MKKYKILLLFVFFSVLVLKVFGTYKLTLDTVIIENNIIRLSSIDGIYYKLTLNRNDSGGLYSLYIDSVLSKKLNGNYLRIKDNIFLIENSKDFLFIDYTGQGDVLHKYKSESGSDIIIDTVQNAFTINNNLLLIGISKKIEHNDGNYSGSGGPPYRDPVTELQSFSFESKVKQNLFKLQKQRNEYEGIVNIIPLPERDKIIIITGQQFSDGTFDDCNYLLFDLKQKSIESLTERINTTNLKSVFTPLGIMNYDYGQNKKIFTDNNYIIDSDLNIIGSYLSISYDILGYQFINEQIISLYVSSELDSKLSRFNYKKGIISYRKNAFLEAAIYKVYQGNKLIDNDIIQLSEKDKNILRKMIYAKHNFFFENEYYQAYFNLYNFYNAKKKTRLKEVKHLFSENDIYNLDFIK